MKKGCRSAQRHEALTSARAPLWRLQNTLLISRLPMQLFAAVRARQQRRKNPRSSSGYSIICNNTVGAVKCHQNCTRKDGFERRSAATAPSDMAQPRRLASTSLGHCGSIVTSCIPRAKEASRWRSDSQSSKGLNELTDEQKATQRFCNADMPWPERGPKSRSFSQFRRLRLLKEDRKAASALMLRSSRQPPRSRHFSAVQQRRGSISVSPKHVDKISVSKQPAQLCSLRNSDDPRCRQSAKFKLVSEGQPSKPSKQDSARHFRNTR